MSMLAAAGWDDWADLPLRDQIYYLLAPVFAVPLALLLIGDGLWIYYRRRSKRNRRD